MPHKAGHYYVDLGVILFRNNGERVLAQVEHFFFGKRTLTLPVADDQPVEFPVTWRSLPPFGFLRHKGDFQELTEDEFRRRAGQQCYDEMLIECSMVGISTRSIGSSNGSE